MAARQRLTERRKALGYSQEKLAEKLGVDRTSVGRWERGEADPQPHNRPRLANVLKVPTSSLDSLLVTDETGGDRQRVAQASLPGAALAHAASNYLDAGDLDEMIRREFLRLLSMTSTLVALPREGTAYALEEIASAAASTDVADYAALNSHLWQVFSLSRSKQAIFPIVREQLSSLNSSLRAARNEAAHRQLCAAAGDLFQLAGEIFFDSNRYTDAAHCYTLAASASKESGNHDLWACALTRHAFIGMYERQFTDALPMLAVAADIAERGDNHLSTRHWVAAVQAEAFAGVGDLSSCKQALEKAAQVHSLSGSVQNGGWLRFDGSRLAEERGTCFAELGRPDLAEAALIDALSQNLSSRRKGSVLTDLASLGAQRHDVDQLLNYANAAIELAQTTGSGYVGRRLQSLQDQLGPLVSDIRVSQLSEHISALSLAR
ncbi:helix-turn-helix transcriptional regulator [Streptomyces sp. NPDC051162]|uniref:helix-turn-helix domain-containing protein n=1 Tax=Streptomyces sp. NPDC051162 TaxID=3154747 RepID=UPI003443424C